MVKVSDLIKREEGSVVILFVVALTILVGMCALVIDIGVAYAEKQKLQNAVDAAALAVANELPDVSAKTYEEVTGVAGPYVTANSSDATISGITFPDPQKTVEVSAERDVEYTFAKVLGFSGTTVRVSATAKKSPGIAFDYVLFAGEVYVDATGNQHQIEGDIYGKTGVQVAGPGTVINGSASYNSVEVPGGNKVPEGVEVEQIDPPLPMPVFDDFGNDIKSQAQAAGTYYNQNKVTLSGLITLDSPIYVDGNVVLKDCTVSGSGCIYATGDITFEGSQQGIDAGEGICLFSETGDITVNGSGSTFKGTVIALGGTITLNGSGDGDTLDGRFIAEKVELHGSKQVITGKDNGMENLPYHVRLID